jgi:hypothetical protein
MKPTSVPSLACRWFSRCRSLGLALGVLPAWTAAADLSATFDAGVEDWHASVPSASLIWQGSGGTPDGYLRGSGANAAWHFVSPTSWAGDWSGYRVIKFDMAIVNRQYADAARNNILVIRGTNGVELAWSGLSPEFTWTHYEVQLLPAAFQVDRSTFDSVMRGVEELRLLGEYTTTAEQVGLDNVLVTTQGPISPANDLMSLFSNGTEDWRPVDDVTLVSDAAEFAGNAGGKLRGNDWADGRVYWFATPISWAGDWSEFKTLLFDLALTGGAGTIDGANLRILGANGQQLDANLGIPSSGTWRHYAVDLAPATFGVDQAFYNAVMAHVVEMRIRGEYIDGGESELLDNVIVTRELRFPMVDRELVANFDADTEGWRVVGNGTPRWSGSGGNPGGFLQGVDGGSGIWYFVAPESWAGDWSLFKQIRFQMKFLSGAYGGGTKDVLHLRTFDGRELVWSGYMQAYSWSPYMIDLTPASFGVDRATFDSAIRNVQSLWIRGESTGVGDDTSGLDSLVVSLSDTPIVPPDRLTRFDAGTEGWRGAGGVSMSWQSSSGNPDGFLRGSDSGSDRWGFASPESWCGDWRSYRLLAFDYRIVSGTYSFGAGDFIVICGMNGTNLVAGIAPPDNTWKHYDLTLSPATFGVDIDTYNAVMRGVFQVLLQAELVSGDDVEAIDNVLLTKASSPYLIWRDQYWTGPDREHESISGVLADPDGDGADNWGEFIADTLPTNRLDVLRFERALVAGSTCQLEFNSRTGRLYDVEATSVLAPTNTWNVVTNDIPGTGLRVTVPTAAIEPRQFYRLKARRLE